MKKIYIIGALACMFASCKPSVNVTVPLTAGEADFKQYLAIGNSLTAGYADNSLYVTGQLNSYPERLFQQFSLITDRGARGEFYQPLLVTENGYPGPKKVLGEVYGCLGDTSFAPVDLLNFGVSSDDAKPYVSPGLNQQINNIGVPGIRVADYAVIGYGSVNPYAKRFYYHPSTESPLDELQGRVNNLHPTFFTMWLGANDVLGFATSGGQGDGSGNAVPAFGSFYNTTDITPVPVFQRYYDTVVAVATSVGAKGALINIPDITSIPFFTTIPSNGLYITRQSLADSLNAYYKAFATSSTNYAFKLGNNQFIVRDHLGNMRQSVPGELILLTTPKDSLTCAGWGSFKPIPEQYVITTEELQQINLKTSEYNAIIKNAATRNNLALIDMYKYMGTLKSGITYNGITYSPQFVTGGAFSLDGVHLTPRGYAIVANRIIEGINDKYHSTVPKVDVNRFNGILFP